MFGDWLAALGVFHARSDRGVNADSAVYNTLLDCCVQNANFNLAEELLALMKERGVPHSNYTLSTVVAMWSRRGGATRRSRSSALRSWTQAGPPWTCRLVPASSVRLFQK